MTEFKNWQFLDTLAASYAETGSFDQAIEWQTKAIGLAPDGNKKSARSNLALYKSSKPFRVEAE